MVNRPVFSASIEWKTIWSSRSPSSDENSRESPFSIASKTSYVSSIRNFRSDSCVCSRSHGQPLGARNRACSATSFSNHLPASLSRPLRGIRGSVVTKPLARTFDPIRELDCALTLASCSEAIVFAIVLRGGKKILFCVAEGIIYKEDHRVTSSE